MILPDAMEVPDKCKLCQHGVTYITMGVKRMLCANGLPMKEECQWFAIRLFDGKKT